MQYMLLTGLAIWIIISLQNYLFKK